MSGFVHIGFAFQGVPKVLDLEPHIKKVCEDWIRYGSTNWILWTTNNAAEIARAIDRAVDEGDQYLITSLVLDDCAGCLSPWVWDWLKSKGANLTTAATFEELLLGYNSQKP